MAIDHVRELIAAALASDPDDALSAKSVEALGVRRTSIVISAAFAYAVMKRFPEDTKLETIRDWVTSARSALATPQEMPQLFAEGLIRSILGEEDLAREVPNERWLPLESWLIYQLVGEVFPTLAGRDEFLDEATRFAIQWLDEARLGGARTTEGIGS